MLTKKYRLLPKQKVSRNGETYVMHRIQALIDIPLHGIKKGDLGGYVGTRKSLSHKGSCWVGGDAIVMNYYSHDMVTGNALVTDNAFISNRVSGNVKVSGNASVHSQLGGNCDISDNVVIGQWVNINGNITLRGRVNFLDGEMFAFGGGEIKISGDVTICCNNDNKDSGLSNNRAIIEAKANQLIEVVGNVNLTNVIMKGNCKIKGDVNLEDVLFSGDNIILGQPKIQPGVKFTGTNVISGDSMIPSGIRIHDVVMDTGTLNYAMPVSGINPLVSHVNHETTVFKNCISLIDQIESEYEAYTTDIVKLITYPAMGDASIPEVGDFLVKLRSAKRLAMISNESELKEMVESLEVAFVRAENKAQILMTSYLDEDSKKSLKTAGQMFRIACDEASPEPEKRLGYKAGMKALEGIVSVSDDAKEAMKARVGVLELEA